MKNEILVFKLSNVFRVKKLDMMYCKVFWEFSEKDGWEMSEEEIIEVENKIKNKDLKSRLLWYYWEFNNWYLNRVYRLYWRSRVWDECKSEKYESNELIDLPF
jgi:hypothetical protein